MTVLEFMQWGQSTQDNEKKPTFAVHMSVCVCLREMVGGKVLTLFPGPGICLVGTNA